MNVNLKLREEECSLFGTIEGEIDTYTAPILREELEAIHIKENLLVVLDLSKVTYIDSTGLGVFIAFYKKVMKENGKFKLVRLSSRLLRLFEITGLSKLMDIETDEKVELTNERI